MCLVLALQSHETPGRCTQERDLVLSIIHAFMEVKMPKETSAMPGVRNCARAHENTDVALQS